MPEFSMETSRARKASMTTCSSPSRGTTVRFRSGLASSSWNTFSQWGDLHQQPGFSVDLPARSQSAGLTTCVSPLGVLVLLQPGSVACFQTTVSCILPHLEYCSVLSLLPFWIKQL
ncbi:hypothetical protein Pcinc_009359 [Petrolisthes cinctipes]|uniref:Uncharacterized protein n=1 Tax=Petrolisthes cinctipes TaxID=88211 RepID=A0AAE1G758_PETCI|nr:hypothetical protein Pcinc_009359 [Petrolisthes cinctipes]